MKMIAFFMCATFLLSCSSTTVIKSTDKDVRIFVDDEYVGKGTVTHTDQKIVGSATRVTLRKEGCEDQTHVISRNEEVDAGACIGGFLLLVPLLWIEKYKAEHTYEFRCEKKS